MYEGPLQTKSSSSIPATDIGNDAFTYARWRHLLAWLLPYKWPNVSILKGVPKFDAPVRGAKCRLVKTTFNPESFIRRLCGSISIDFGTIRSWNVCRSQKIYKNLYFGVQGHTRSLLSVLIKSQCMTSY